MTEHLGITQSHTRYAIITGNPERVHQIAKMYDKWEHLSSRRGFVCFSATQDQEETLIVSSGIGGPSTASGVEELIELGIHTIVRIGTCGALQPQINVGDFVVPTGCVRSEGTSRQYIDLAFPAVPDYEILNEMMNHLISSQAPYHLGITHCKDAYYSEKPEKSLSPDKMKTEWEVWHKAGVLATEMESSTLFILGSLRHIRTGAIFINVGKNTEKDFFYKRLYQCTSLVQAVINHLSHNTDEQRYLPYVSHPITESYLDRESLTTLSE